MNGLNHDEGRTVIIVTHEQDIAAQARRVITMRDGMVVSDGPPERVPVAREAQA